MAKEELIRNAGNQFDPEVVDIFLDILERYGGDPVNR
jgi:HD-GYP domain-containing protein (c-di-GMP phosphodiesterase class II)